MDIKGKVHCFFEQSGTFKHEFIKLGIPAEDYDIQNNFGETDHINDLFQAIEDASPPTTPATLYAISYSANIKLTLNLTFLTPSPNERH